MCVSGLYVIVQVKLLLAGANFVVVGQRDESNCVVLHVAAVTEKTRQLWCLARISVRACDLLFSIKCTRCESSNPFLRHANVAPFTESSFEMIFQLCGND